MIITPREEKIQETIRKSKEAFLLAEQNRLLSLHEFIWIQFKLIRKIWWLLQFLLLLFLWFILLSVRDDRYIQRSMGIMASLFVILIIPEIWKNRICRSMEIESSAYYSLRQIYAARMLLFGLADTLLLTLFFGAALSLLHFNIMDLLIQFLFPMTVTACICFRTLCSRKLNESGALLLCVLWSVTWLLIVLNENIYTLVAVPVWMLLLITAMTYLAMIIYQTITKSTNYWEVFADGTEIK